MQMFQSNNKHNKNDFYISLPFFLSVCTFYQFYRKKYFKK